MKYSIVVADGTFSTNTAALLGTFDSVAGRAADIGFQAIQLTVNKPSEVNIKELQTAMARHSIAVSSIATGRGYTVDGLCLSSGNYENRMAAVHRMKEHMDLGAEIGNAKAVIGAIRGWAKDAGGREAYIKQLRESLLELVEYGEKKNIEIVFESNDHFETDLLLNIEDTSAFIREIGSKKLKLQLDTMHIYNENDDFYPATLRNGDLIGQVDISGPDRCVPCDNFDYALLLKALKQVNYQEYLVFEHVATPPENAAKAGFDYIQSLLAKL